MELKLFPMSAKVTNRNQKEPCQMLPPDDQPPPGEPTYLAQDELQAAKDFLSSSLYGEHPLARAAHTVIRALNLANEAADMIAKERDAWNRSCLEWQLLAIKNNDRCEAAEQALEGMWTGVSEVISDLEPVQRHLFVSNDGFRAITVQGIRSKLARLITSRAALNPTPQGGKPALDDETQEDRDRADEDWFFDSDGRP